MGTRKQNHRINWAELELLVAQNPKTGWKALERATGISESTLRHHFVNKRLLQQGKIENQSLVEVPTLPNGYLKQFAEEILKLINEFESLKKAKIEIEIKFTEYKAEVAETLSRLR